MDILALDVPAQTLAVVGFAVIAVIKFVDLIFDKDWRSAAKILGAALAGFGLAFAIDGLAAIPGILLGLSASGLITTAGYTKKTTPVGILPEQG